MFLEYLKNDFNIRKAVQLLKVLIIIDFLFILCHIFIVIFWDSLDQLNRELFLITKDGGYAEFFQYLKYVLIIYVLAIIILKKKVVSYLFWLLLFIFLLLDDSLRFHEIMGNIFSVNLNIQPFLGLRPQDLGELLFVAIVGLILAIFLFIGYKKGDENYKNTSLDLIILFSIFLFFGVGVDMIHGIFGANKYAHFILALIEDGGEMIVLSLICWYIYHIQLNFEKQDQYLHKYFYKPRNKN